MSAHWRLLCWLLDGHLVSRQSLAPEPIEFRAKAGQPIGIDSVNALFAGRRIDHEAGVFEYFQVLRDRRPADRQGTSQLTNRARMLDQQLEDRAPGRVAE